MSTNFNPQLVLDNIAAGVFEQCSGRSDDQLLAGLNSLFQGQLKLNLPIQYSPAIVTDHDNKILSVCAGHTNDPIRIPMVSALTDVTRRKQTPDLSDSGVKLFVCGDRNGLIEGAGALSSFAPSEVSILRSDQIQVQINPTSANYYHDVTRDRGLQFNFSDSTTTLPEKRIYDQPSWDLPELARVLELVDEHADELATTYINAHRTVNHWIGSRVAPISNAVRYQRIMKVLHSLAFDNVSHKGGPFAAAIISPNDEIVSLGSNRVVPMSDPLMHGEVNAIERGLKATGKQDLAGYTMITSSQTCIACAETAARVGLKKIVVGNRREAVEEHTIFSEGPLREDFFDTVGITQDILANGEDFKAFEEFMKQLKQDPSATYLKKS